MPGGTYHCGPLEVDVRADDPALHDKVNETLSLFDLRWDPPYRFVRLKVSWGPAAPIANGDVLTCARMTVDAAPDGVVATTTVGAAARATYTDDGEDWALTAPREAGAAGRLEEIEDLIGLALTTGWRRAGWVPLHAAAVSRHERTAILCGASGAGKSTLTAALVHRGWQALGDDKLLLRTASDGRPALAALLHTFNLHPRTQAWLPEVGELEQLPVYSAWTEKRKVSVADIWPDGVARDATPTHVVQLERRDDATGVEVTELDRAEVLPILMRQTVVPADRQIARQIMSTLAATSRHLEARRIVVGGDAYRHPDVVAELDDAIR